MGKGLIVIIIGALITLVTVNVGYIKVISSGSDNAMEYYSDVQARNMGNTAISFLLSRIADSVQYRTDGETMYFEDGSVDYRVVDTALVVGDTLVKIQTEIEFLGKTKHIQAFLYPNEPGGWVPPYVRAAWTANGDLNKTISDMYIDGRDHDSTLMVVPGSGVYGVSTSVEFSNTETAQIGGTYDSTDYVMTYPEDPDVIEEFYNWEGEFPTSPDEILGYPEGTLKWLAQSGVMGGQYLEMVSADDIDESHLNFPLSGVTYVEINDVKERNLKMKGPGNQGILVVHGPGASSRLKGLKIEPWTKTKKPKTKDGDPVILCHSPGNGAQVELLVDADKVASHLAHGDMVGGCPDPADSIWFKGLIVTDYSFHHHLDILGAIIQLSPNLEMDKNCNGNQDHWVFYSSWAIERVTGDIARESGYIGNCYNFLYQDGIGDRRQKPALWYE